MHKKLILLWNKLKSSFWFVPIVIIFLTVLIAFGLLYFDKYMESYKPSGILQHIFTGSPNSGRNVLSTISGAMIGVAGTVFSITLVALTLAANQFGSRLLQNFMHNRLNQVVLGTYLSMYVYCLIILNAIKENDHFSFMPYFSILFAILATIANIILLIFFIHNISINIQANQVVANVYESLSKNIATLFPEKIGEERKDDKKPTDIDFLLKKYPYRKEISLNSSGYLQYIDEEKLFEDAVKRNQLIQINYRPGNFLVQDMSIGTVYSKEKFEDNLIEDVRKYFTIGRTRTSLQDSEFSIHQMVEIASRALSPGINDPYTAIVCIDNLTSIFCYLTKVQFPSKFRYDEKSDLKAIMETVTYEGMLDAAFNQIRQYSKETPAVTIRLMEALITIRKFAKNDTQIKTIHKHADMILRLAEKSFVEKNDLEDLRDRWRTFTKS